MIIHPLYMCSMLRVLNKLNVINGDQLIAARREALDNTSSLFEAWDASYYT